MEKNFGFTFAAVFGIISFYPLIIGNGINFYFLAIALLFLFITLVIPNKLTKMSKLWLIFGAAIGKFTSPIIMMIVYIISVVPTGIIIKLFMSDLLDIKIQNKKKSYWKNPDDFDDSLNNQF
jgi:hypothetical protein